MNRSLIELTAAESGERIDALLAQNIEGISRSAAQRLISEGAVTLSGVPVKKNHRTAEGECYAVALPDLSPRPPAAQDIPLDIVYEDDDVIVVNKPRGMVVHPAPGHEDGTLVNALINHCGKNLSGIGGEFRPGIVHRIDRDTSGLLVAAKNDAAHVFLSEQLSGHSMYRVYEAVVLGRMKDRSGVVDVPIGRDARDRKKMAANAKNSRSAVTHWELITQYRACSHIRCRLETGRTHQIRVHMAYTGHPVLGDPVYGRASKICADAGGQCLHAREIRFIHPVTGEEMRFTTELPDYFIRILARLGPPEA